MQGLHLLSPPPGATTGSAADVLLEVRPANPCEFPRKDPQSVYETSLGARRAGIVMHGVFYGGSGYAQENLPLVLALSQHRIPIQIAPQQFQQDVRNLLDFQTRAALEVLKVQPLDLARSVLFQCVPAPDFRLDLYGKRRVGRTMFETDSLPPDWVEQCNQMDEVWVPSHFNFGTFAGAGVDEKKLRVMQEGEDTSLFRPGAEPLQIPQRRDFNFLSVFEWIGRKGWDVLLRAYVTEFKPDEGVTLMLRAYGRPPDRDLLPEIAYFIERHLRIPLEKTPPILILPGFLPNAVVPRLYTAADCFVLPTRSEGWGRPYTEALACEVPVIATRWSGQLDFLTDENSYLVEIDGLSAVPADVDAEVYAGHRWAEPSVEHLRAQMRHVFTHREEAKAKARRGRQDIVSKHDWTVIASQWAREFERLLT